MKNKMKLSLCLTILIFVSSCSKWLDVKPKTEIKSEVQFLSEQGFKDAVFGCYILMCENSLYGKELSTNFIDVLAQQYDLKGSTKSTYYYTTQYRYDMNYNKSIIDAIWLNMYKILANVNNIIENLETNGKILHPTTYKMIKGEMYGLRAFIHFELFKMFGCSNVAFDKNKLLTPILPYVKEYKKGIIKQHNGREILDFIYEDLRIASDLLEKYDPMANNTERLSDYFIEKNDVFFKDRKYRFNYYAVLSTYMRAKLWEGNYKDAKETAKTIIDNCNIGWIEDAVINNGTEGYRDLCFVTEQIFGLETNKRFDDIIKPYFKLQKQGGSVENDQCFYHLRNRAEKLYEIESNIGLSDYRYTRLYNKISTEYEILKFWEYDNMKLEYVNNLPIIKKPEIYYTIAECLNQSGNETDRIEAIHYLNLTRRARGIVESKDLSNDLSQAQVEEEITKEWKKEFISEGQMFYFYKRKGISSIQGSNIAMDDTKYMFPIPENEIDFGGRVDINRK